MENDKPPRLLDRVRDTMRVRHYSQRTEDAYVGWIRRFILFHGKRHPLEMGAGEVNTFLTDLAVKGEVSASTQTQALSALIFLYRSVLNRPLPHLDLVRASRTRRLPVVLTRDEVSRLFQHLEGVPRIVVTQVRRPPARPIRGEKTSWLQSCLLMLLMKMQLSRGEPHAKSHSTRESGDAGELC